MFSSDGHQDQREAQVSVSGWQQAHAVGRRPVSQHAQVQPSSGGARCPQQPSAGMLHQGGESSAISQIDGLAQDCSNSSALAMELLQSCTKPLKWFLSPTSNFDGCQMNNNSKR